MGGMCMRIFLILLAIFISNTISINAAPVITSKVEKINLKLMEDEAAVSFLALSTGEATLVQGPHGKNILVNAGGKGTKAELEGWLNLYGVKEISALILTNDGQEVAFNTINRLISKYNIKEILTTTELSAHLTKNLGQEKQIAIVAWDQGTRQEILPQLTAEVQFAGYGSDEGMDLKLKFFKHTIFLMTSSSHRAEEILLKKDLKNVSIFKLPNCATEDSLSRKVIEFVNPQIAIFFASARQKLDRDILHDLQDAWSEVYFTKKHGTVTIKLTDENYEVITIPIEADE